MEKPFSNMDAIGENTGFNPLPYFGKNLNLYFTFDRKIDWKCGHFLSPGPRSLRASPPEKGETFMSKLRKMRKLGWIAVILLTFALAACQTPAGRSAGTVVDDGTITTKVKAKLFDDERLSGFAISVETFQGEVTLTGAVDSEQLKEQATEVAQSVTGVKKVNNLLNVQ